MSQQAIQPYLQTIGAVLTTTGLQLPKDMSETTWEVASLKVDGASESLEWARADLAKRGDTNATLKAWCVKYHKNYGTRRTMASVAGRIAPERRRESISFWTHREIAKFPPEEQTRLLDIIQTFHAQGGHISIKELRKQIKEDRLKKLLRDNPPNVEVPLHSTADPAPVASETVATFDPPVSAEPPPSNVEVPLHLPAVPAPRVPGSVSTDTAAKMGTGTAGGPDRDSNLRADYLVRTIQTRPPGYWTLEAFNAWRELVGRILEELWTAQPEVIRNEFAGRGPVEGSSQPAASVAAEAVSAPGC